MRRTKKQDTAQDEQAQQAADVAAPATNDASEGAQPAPKPKRARKAKSGGSKPKAKAKRAAATKKAPATKAKPKKAAKAKAKDEVPGVWWRLATVTNEKSGREITLELKKDGSLVPSDAKRTGLTRVDAWTEVHAPTRVIALQKIAAGEGKQSRHSKKGPVEA